MNFLVGQIILYPSTSVPRWWAACNGQILAMEEYVELHSLIGNRFGGDGTATFALPDYQKQAPEGSQYIMAVYRPE